MTRMTAAERRDAKDRRQAAIRLHNLNASYDGIAWPTPPSRARSTRTRRQHGFDNGCRCTNCIDAKTSELDKKPPP